MQCRSGVTTMVKCPYCNRAAMSLLRKSALGPGRAVSCQSCGKKVSAHWAAIFAAFPAFLGGLFLMRTESPLLGIVAVMGGVLIMGVIHTCLVPLVRNDV